MPVTRDFLVVRTDEGGDAGEAGTVDADAGANREGSRTDAETVARFSCWLLAHILAYLHTRILGYL